MAGLRFIAPGFDGGDPVFTSMNGGTMQRVTWPSVSGNAKFIIDLTEDEISVDFKGKSEPWCLELSTVPGAVLPFGNITTSSITASMGGIDYSVTLLKGSVEDLRSQGDGKVFRLVPSGKSIRIKMTY